MNNPVDALSITALCVSIVALVASIVEYRRVTKEQTHRRVNIHVDEVKRRFRLTDDEQYMIKGEDGISFVMVFRTDSDEELYEKIKKITTK